MMLLKHSGTLRRRSFNYGNKNYNYNYNCLKLSSSSSSYSSSSKSTLPLNSTHNCPSVLPVPTKSNRFGLSLPLYSCSFSKSSSFFNFSSFPVSRSTSSSPASSCFTTSFPFLKTKSQFASTASLSPTSSLCTRRIQSFPSIPISISSRYICRTSSVVNVNSQNENLTSYSYPLVDTSIKGKKIITKTTESDSRLLYAHYLKRSKSFPLQVAREIMVRSMGRIRDQYIDYVTAIQKNQHKARKKENHFENDSSKATHFININKDGIELKIPDNNISSAKALTFARISKKDLQQLSKAKNINILHLLGSSSTFNNTTNNNNNKGLQRKRTKGPNEEYQDENRIKIRPVNWKMLQQMKKWHFYQNAYNSHVDLMLEIKLLNRMVNFLQESRNKNAQISKENLLSQKELANLFYLALIHEKWYHADQFLQEIIKKDLQQQEQQQEQMEHLNQQQIKLKPTHVHPKENQETKKYLHISPSGDWWIASEIHAAKHNPDGYICSIPLASFINFKSSENIMDDYKLEEKLNSLSVDDFQRLYDLKKQDQTDSKKILESLFGSSSSSSHPDSDSGYFAPSVSPSSSISAFSSTTLPTTKMMKSTYQKRNNRDDAKLNSQDIYTLLGLCHLYKRHGSAASFIEKLLSTPYTTNLITRETFEDILVNSCIFHPKRYASILPKLCRERSNLFFHNNSVDFSISSPSSEMNLQSSMKRREDVKLNKKLIGKVMWVIHDIEKKLGFFSLHSTPFLLRTFLEIIYPSSDILVKGKQANLEKEFYWLEKTCDLIARQNQQDLKKTEEGTLSSRRSKWEKHALEAYYLTMLKLLNACPEGERFSFPVFTTLMEKKLSPSLELMVKDYPYFTKLITILKSSLEVQNLPNPTPYICNILLENYKPFLRQTQSLSLDIPDVYEYIKDYSYRNLNSTGNELTSSSSTNSISSPLDLKGYMTIMKAIGQEKGDWAKALHIYYEMQEYGLWGYKNHDVSRMLLKLLGEAREVDLLIQLFESLKRRETSTNTSHHGDMSLTETPVSIVQHNNSTFGKPLENNNNNNNNGALSSLKPSAYHVLLTSLAKANEKEKLKMYIEEMQQCAIQHQHTTKSYTKENNNTINFGDSGLNLSDYQAIISSLGQVDLQEAEQYFRRAEKLFKDMMTQSIPNAENAFISCVKCLLNSYGNYGMFNEGKQLFLEYKERFSSKFSHVLYPSMLQLCLESENLEEALSLLNELENDSNSNPNTLLAVYNLLLLHCNKHGNVDLAASLYSKIWKHRTKQVDQNLSTAVSKDLSFYYDTPPDTLASRTRLLATFITAGKLEDAISMLNAWEKGNILRDDNQNTMKGVPTKEKRRFNHIGQMTVDLPMYSGIVFGYEQKIKSFFPVLDMEESHESFSSSILKCKTFLQEAINDVPLLCENLTKKQKIKADNLFLCQVASFYVTADWSLLKMKALGKSNKSTNNKNGSNLPLHLDSFSFENISFTETFLDTETSHHNKSHFLYHTILHKLATPLTNQSNEYFDDNLANNCPGKECNEDVKEFELARIHLFMRIFCHMLQVDSILPSKTTTCLLLKVARQYQILNKESELEVTESPNLLNLYGYHLEDFIAEKLDDPSIENIQQTLEEQFSYSDRLDSLEEEIDLKLNLSRVTHHKRDTIVHE